MNITTKDRTELRSYFKRNCIPTEEHFKELIDGMLNQKDDGIVKIPDNPLCIEAVGEGDSKDILHFYQNFNGSAPDWKFNFKSNDGKLGFSISDGGGDSRLFIDKNTGYIGIGTTNPEYKLEVDGTIKATKLKIGNTEIEEQHLQTLKKLAEDNLKVWPSNKKHEQYPDSSDSTSNIERKWMGL